MVWGSRKRKWRAKRLAKLAEKERERRGESAVATETNDDEDGEIATINGEDGDDIEESPFAGRNTGVRASRYGRDDESVSSSGEENSYDPHVLGVDDTTWLLRARCLGFNADAVGLEKAFMTSQGRYDDYKWFRLSDREDNQSQYFYPESDNIPEGVEEFQW